MWEHSVARKLIAPGLSHTTITHLRSMLVITAGVFLLSAALAALGVWLERRKLYGAQTSSLEIRQGLVSNVYANSVFALVIVLALVFRTPYVMYAFLAFFLEEPITRALYPNSRSAH